jgi:hypothetical protein
MPKISRAHHFVPQFMLAGFTDDGTRNGFLWVSDFKAVKQWKSRPINVGHERDYYQVRSEGVSPDLVERALGHVESAAAPVIAHVMSSETFPDDPQQRADLLLFISLLATRVPSAREMVNSAADTLNKAMLRAALGSRERWEALENRAAKAGYIPNDVLSYERALEMLDSDAFTVRASQDYHLATMLEGALAIFPLLQKRRWSVLLSAAGRFVCSDRPVVVAFTRPKPAIWSPGFGVQETEVTMPLSRNSMVVGSWDSEPGTLPLNYRQIARHNSRALRHASRFVFSARQDSPWLDAEGQARTNILEVSQHGGQRLGLDPATEAR